MHRLIAVTVATILLGAMVALTAAFAGKGSLSQIDAMRRSNYAAEHPGSAEHIEACKRKAQHKGFAGPALKHFVRRCKNKND